MFQQRLETSWHCRNDCEKDSCTALIEERACIRCTDLHNYHPAPGNVKAGGSVAE
jgi:hypothetical protein